MPSTSHALGLPTNDCPFRVARTVAPSASRARTRTPCRFSLAAASAAAAFDMACRRRPAAAPPHPLRFGPRVFISIPTTVDTHSYAPPRARDLRRLLCRARAPPSAPTLVPTLGRPVTGWMVVKTNTNTNYSNDHWTRHTDTQTHRHKKGRIYGLY
jgi:hypothetical protein